MAASLNQCAGPFGRAYDFYIERERLMRVVGRAVWGVDVSVLYSSMGRIASADDGATILDVPCGGGVAFRALRPDQDVRYIAADISQAMLERARRRAAKRSLSQVEFALADMLALPFEDGSADLVVSFSGLHMLDEPDVAIAEIARCVRPGGQLVGTTFLLAGSRRQRRLFEIGHRRGHALPPNGRDLRRWLDDSGIEAATITPDRGFAVFAGRKPPEV